MLASNDAGSARAAADELRQIAVDLPMPYLRAAAAHSCGAVRLAEGDARAAVGILREGLASWHELDAPYESARTRELVAAAHRALGDDDSAAMELDACARVYAQLGAATDLARLEATSAAATSTTSGVLTAREVEVLQLVATGKTNRAIAEALGISEKTVARHVSNMFMKLGLSSRAAATAYAYQHDLTALTT